MTLSHEILGEEEKCLYEVMFLKNDRHQDVYIELVEKINSEELGKRLQLGEQVFITSRLSQKRNAPGDW
jgi:hypothetical protein